MKNIFSSPTGLTKVLQIKFIQLNEKLDTLNKNILYITYKVDKISKYQATLDASELYDTHQEEEGNDRSEDV